MNVQAIKTGIITAESNDLLQVLDQYLLEMNEGGILAITSKIVSLCEQRVVPTTHATKQQLVEQEAQRYTGPLGQYGFHFTVTQNTLIPSAGIDASNADGNFVLWPTDAQATANQVRAYLQRRFKVEHVGVIITDSTCTPMRRGVMGVCLAHSGFSSTNDYAGKPDLFGRPFSTSRSNIAGGLAASAVLTMGEGSEMTPLCLITDVSFVQFRAQDPSQKELQETYIPLEEDVFAPFLSAVSWHRGQGS
jgi:dihydrofolate synthase / folylpolyglutamate synthase